MTARFSLTSVGIGSDGQLRVGGDAFANAIEVARVGGGYGVTDSLAPLEFGSGCFPSPPPHEAICQAAAAAPVRIDGNAGADNLTVIGDTGEAVVIGDALRMAAGPAASMGRVPTISAFYGILIRMYFGDHPPPHFHARYGEHKARCAIATGEVIDGELPVRAARLVREWAALHRSELDENWRRCEQRLPLSPVDPLP